MPNSTKERENTVIAAGEGLGTQYWRRKRTKSAIWSFALQLTSLALAFGFSSGQVPLTSHVELIFISAATVTLMGASYFAYLSWRALGREEYSALRVLNMWPLDMIEERRSLLDRHLMEGTVIVYGVCGTLLVGLGILLSRWMHMLIS